jgi:hypothetical protein
MYMFFCFKIELKNTKADLYMPCKAMAHSTKYILTYVENIYNYFYNFKSPVEYAMMKIEITIRNGQSLELCQMRQVAFLSLSSATSTQLTTNRGLTWPISGLWGGLGVGREGRGVGGEKRRSSRGARYR